MAPVDSVERACCAGENRHVEQDPDDPELCRDGQRRRVRDEVLQRAEVSRQPLACARLAAEADPCQRMVLEHLRGQRDSPRPVARRFPHGRMRDLRSCDAHRGERDDDRRCERKPSRARIAGDECRGEHYDEQRRVARLRIREVQTRPHHRDQGRRRNEGDLPQPQTDDEHGDPQHDVSPVKARIAEERRDAEERRVRVRDLEIVRVEASRPPRCR